MLRAFPHADLRALVVWINMLRYDEYAAAQRGARQFDADPRVSHFYDRTRIAGRALAQALGGDADAVAWDVYAVFDSGAVWDQDAPPAPVDWAHQLHNSRWADRARYRQGAALQDALRAMVARLVE